MLWLRPCVQARLASQLALLFQASALAASTQFPNPYCLSKWLAERLVADRCAAGLPAAAVRPSIIGAVAGTPYPGQV